MALGLDDALKAVEQIEKSGFGRVEVVIVNGAIKTIKYCRKGTVAFRRQRNCDLPSLA